MALKRGDASADDKRGRHGSYISLFFRRYRLVFAGAGETDQGAVWPERLFGNRQKLRHLACGKALYLFRSGERSFLGSEMMPLGSMGRFAGRVAEGGVRPQKNLRAQVSLARRYVKREGFFKVI